MYSSGYSQVSKYSPQAQKKMQYRTKSKGCGYYMRIVFFFSSLIQSLIIVSLVLFLVYGKKQDSSATERIQDLEESFSSLSLENVELRKQRKNLTTLLNATLIEKARNDWDLARIRHISNISSIIIEEINRQQQQCQAELSLCRGASRFNDACSTQRTLAHRCDCGLQVERLVVKLELVESNFSRTAERMRMETDLIARDRDNINLEAIRLRRDKAALERELQHYRQRCKEDFRLSLSGIGNVSKAFLQKIETLFPTHLSFQLTCEKQQEHLEQIRSNCTNLSRDVEDKFQRYLNNVGEQVSNIQRENSRLKTENGLLNEDYRKCSQNRTGMMREHSAYINQLQLKHDKDTERLLMEKYKLSGDLELLNKSIKLKNKEVEHLSDQVRQLNSTCIFRQPFAGGSTNRFTSAWNLNNGSPFNKPTTGGLGSTGYGSTGINTGIGGGGSPYNRPATGGLGSTNYGSAGSNTGYGAGGSQYNKPATGGYGSTGLNTGVGAGSAYNKPATGGYGSTGSNTGVGAGVSTYNKPATGGYGSTGSNTGTGAGGSPYNKPAAGGYGSTGSNTGVGAGASTYNKPATGGYGSTGSNTGVGAGASTYNKPATGGYGSTGSNTGQGAGGSTYNKPATGGIGSSSYGSAGSGINKVATSAAGSSTGSASSGINKQGTSATGSSSYGSTGSSSGGASAVKPVTNSRGTSTQGQTPGSAGSTGSTGSAGTGVNKPASSGSSASTGKSLSSWWSFGGSSNTQNKPGSTAGKGTSSGSPVGTGRTSGVGGGSINVAQHLLELQRIVNPSAPEEKQDLSRMLG